MLNNPTFECATVINFTDRSCPVCLEDFSDKSSEDSFFEKRISKFSYRNIYPVDCGEKHLIHRDCEIKLIKAKSQSDDLDCPICRRTIIKLDDQDSLDSLLATLKNLQASEDQSPKLILDIEPELMKYSQSNDPLAVSPLLLIFLKEASRLVYQTEPLKQVLSDASWLLSAAYMRRASTWMSEYDINEAFQVLKNCSSHNEIELLSRKQEATSILLDIFVNKAKNMPSNAKELYLKAKKLTIDTPEAEHKVSILFIAYTNFLYDSKHEVSYEIIKELNILHEKGFPDSTSLLAKIYYKKQYDILIDSKSFCTDDPNEMEQKIKFSIINGCDSLKKKAEKLYTSLPKLLLKKIKYQLGFQRINEYQWSKLLVQLEYLANKPSEYQSEAKQLLINKERLIERNKKIPELTQELDSDYLW